MDYEAAPHIVELEVKQVTDEASSTTDEASSSTDANTDEWRSASIRYPADTPSQWKVRPKVPRAIQGQNLQYVVEVAATYNNGSSPPQQRTETFTYPKLCDGRRGFARNYNEAVTLTLSGNPDSIEIWGAWATGYGQVSLTPKLVLFKGGDQEL